MVAHWLGFVRNVFFELNHYRRSKLIESFLNYLVSIRESTRCASIRHEGLVLGELIEEPYANLDKEFLACSKRIRATVG